MGNKPRARAERAWAALLFVAIGASAAHAQQPAEPSLSYTVLKSDKLIRLSRDLLQKPSDWNEVARFNGMKDPNFILPGQRLRIPLRLLKRAPAGARVVSVQGEVLLGTERVTVGMAVPEGAGLRVGHESSAVIELGDGSRVKLLPNTQAELALSRNYLMRGEPSHWFSGAMRLARGAVETVAAKISGRATPLEVTTPTSTIGVRATEFRVAYEDTAARITRAEVTEGQVRADNTAQQSGADLPRGTGAALDPTQREVRVVQLLPAPDLSGLPAQALKPLGAWPLPVLAGASAFRIQVAADARFDGIVRDIRVAGASVELGTLDAGNWHVRVRGIDAQGIEGFDAARVVAVTAARLRVTSSSLRLEGGRTELRVAFDAAPAGAVSAVIAAGEALSAPLRQAQLANGALDLTGLAPGSYFIQLRVAQAAGTIATDVQRLLVPQSWGDTVFDSFNPIVGR